MGGQLLLPPALTLSLSANELDHSRLIFLVPALVYNLPRMRSSTVADDWTT